MAVVITCSNHFKYQLGKKMIDFSADVFKAILMNTTFTFNKDNHATLADVTADQLATLNGYTQNSKTLANVAYSEDDSDDAGKAVWDNVTWTAAGGNIGPTGAAIIYDDSTSDDTIVACIDFGTDYTIPDTANFQLQQLCYKNL
jgi:hypothetical protein